MKITCSFLTAICLMNVTLSIKAQTWSPVGAGTNASVRVFEIYDSSLIAGGDFSIAGGVGANRIAIWNGANWSTLGLGADGAVYALKSYNNELFIGTTGGGAGGGTATSNCIAKWDGINWYSVGNQGMSGGGSGGQAAIFALEEYNGNIYAGGYFKNVESTNIVNYIAKWDYVIWDDVSTSGGLSATSTSLLIHNGNLYIGGAFTTAGGIAASRIATWNGTNYAALGSGLNNYVNALKVYNGELYVAGGFSIAGGATAIRIAKWDGTNWSNVGGGLSGGFYPEVYALEVYNGELYAGGSFTMADGLPANHIAKWNGTNWAPLGAGTDTTVRAMKVWNNDLYVGGSFTIAGGTSANYIAKWNEPVGLKDPDLSDELSVYPNPAGNVIAIKYKNKIEVISLADVCGKRYDVSLNDKNEIDISRLASGIYFLQIKTSEGVGTKKIVVQK